jgi:hypothetical protein
VQHAQGFCNSGAEVLNSAFGILLNICTKLNICALNAPPSQSPKPLEETIDQDDAEKRFLNNSKIKFFKE